jgi:hypothetical protein
MKKKGIAPLFLEKEEWCIAETLKTNLNYYDKLVGKTKVILPQRRKLDRKM